MTEVNLIRSIQRWEYEGGRMMQPEHLHRRCLTQNLGPAGAGRRLDHTTKKRIGAAAVPRKPRKPNVSVTAVTKMLDASAGSIFRHFKPNGTATPASAPT